jgi:Cadherin-like/Bacterial cadherin-like domain
MSPQSHGQQLLEALYRRLLDRARELCAWDGSAVVDWSSAMEELPRRMLFSITPVGGELLLDAATSNAQTNIDVAVMSNGSSVAVWTSTLQDGSGNGVFGRMFDASGNPAGSEFQINQQTTNNQDHARVAADPTTGKFVVSWTDWNVNANVFARIYNADGTPAGNAFQVNTTSAGTQESPDVAVNSGNGNFIIAWDGAGAVDSSGIYARSFQSDGTPLSGEVLINSNTSSTQNNPAVAINASGNAIVAWSNQVSGITKMAARRVGAATVPVGSEFAPGVPASGDNEADAAVAIDSGGNFIVAYDSHSAGANTWDVFSRRYNSSATALDASPVTVNTTVAQQQQDPSIAIQPTGEYLIAWDSQLQDGSNAGIYAQLFAADGSRDGSEFLVNTTTSLGQQRPATAWVGSAMIVAWDGNGAGDADGVFAQLFASNIVTPNLPPVITVPAGQTITEDTPLVFSTVGGDAISIADGNAGAFPLQITLAVTSGALTLSGTTGLTFTSGDGSGDASMAFTGTLSAINAALNGLTFTPAANASGAVTLNIAADDLGNGGTGGAMTDSESVSVTVTAVNDAPVITAPANASINEDSTLIFSMASGNAISLADVDAGSSPMQMTLTASSGTLTLASVAGLSFTTGDGTADASMTFTGTLTAINAALNGLSFSPPGDSSGADSISLSVNDQGNSGAGGALSGSAAVNVAVAAVNDAPSLSGSHDFSQIDEDDTANIGELVSTLIAGKITDIDGPGVGIAVIAADNSNGSWQFSTNGGTSWTNFGNVNAGSARLLASNANTRVRFVPAADFNGTVSPGITFRAWDQSSGSNGGTANASSAGGATAFSSATASSDITVRSINDAPLNTIPSNLAVNEDSVLTFTGSKLISVTDVDAGTSAIDVTLAVTDGTLTLAGTTGLSFLIGDGTADAQIYFSGTLTAINAALNGMTFTADANFNGFAGFAITSNDKGSSGFGGQQSDSDSFAITVNAVNDSPVNIVPSAAQTTAEDTPLTFSSSAGNAITVADIDATTLRVTLHATSGTVTLPILTGLTMVSGDGTADKDVTFDGTAAAINTALDGLIFSPTANFNGVASLQIVTSDRGQTGIGGTQTDTDSVPVTVTPVNDAPGINKPGPQSVLENSSLTLNGPNKISIADVDAAGSPVQLTLAVTHGVLTLASLGGLSFTAGDGTTDATMVLTGAVSAINSALNGLTFTPDVGYLGNASIQIDVNDQANTGVGGALTDSDTLDVEVVTEFRANTATDNTQNQPSVAIDPSGNFVAVWAGNQNTDESSGFGIWAQLYDNTGTPVGSEIHVNLTTANDQLAPTVGMDSAGNFVVAWASSGQDGNGWGVYARRFSFDGTPLGGEIAVNQTTSGNQDQPTIAVEADGSFAIAWRTTRGGAGSDVYARRFNANGSAAANEFRVNTNVTDNQDQPAIATSTSGHFVISWRSNHQDGSGGGVFARLYDSSGNALTGEIQANVSNSGNQDRPAVSMAADGSFVVSWASGNDQDGDKHGIYTRRFDAAGNALSGEFLVNTTTSDDQNVPTVAAAPNGAFTVAWASNNQDGSGKGIYAQKFDAAGNATGLEFRVSGTTFNNQDQPAATISAAGDLVVLWQGNGIGDTSGVFGQFYRSANHAPLNTVPGAQTVNEDTPLTFSSGNGNAIAIGGGAGVIQVSLAVTNGVATLSHTAGLTFIVGDGAADDTMTILGTQAAINAALAGLRFGADANFNGAAQLRITTTDSSSGNTLNDQDTVNITVAPVNDAPTTSGIANVNASEDAGDIVISLPASFSDIEDAAAALAYTIAGDTNAALFDSLTINPTTHEIVFDLAHNANGSSSITIRASDGGGLFVQATFPLNVAAVNDAPVLVADAGATVDPGTSVAITTAMLQLADVDNSPAQLAYTITSLPASGTLELSGSPLSVGQTFTQADIDGGRVAYRQSGAVNSAGSSDAFGFSGSDGAGGTLATSNFAITINAAPPAPPPPPPIPPIGPSTPPAPSTPPTSSGGNTPAPPPVEVDTTDSGNGGDKTGGGGSGNGTGGGSATGLGRGEGGHSGGGGGGGGGNSSSAAPSAPPQQPDTAAPVAAKPAQVNKDADANAKAQQPALVQKDTNISIAGIDALRPPPPPVAAPLAVAPPPPPAAPVAFINNIADTATAASSPIIRQLDEMHKQVTGEQHTIRLVAGSATVVSLGLSVLYILWTIRAGYLLAGLLSSMPAWTFVDPLPILDHFDDALRRKRRDEDGESLETLVNRQTTNGKSAEGALS